MTKVKLCGLSRESDIAAVNKLKPDLEIGRAHV